MTSIVLITGASGGIGRALARQLHTQALRVAWSGATPPVKSKVKS